MITDEQLAALDQAERAMEGGDNAVIGLTRKEFRELLDEVKAHRKVQMRQLPHTSEDFAYSLTFHKDRGDMAIEDLAKLRAELVAARDAMQAVMNTFDWDGITDTDIVDKTEDILPPAIKRIDDTLGDG